MTEPNIGATVILYGWHGPERWTRSWRGWALAAGECDRHPGCSWAELDKLSWDVICERARNMRAALVEAVAL